MIGPALGPILGGYIIDNLHWPFIFLVNLPVGIIGHYLINKFVPVDEVAVENSSQLAGSALDLAGNREYRLSYGY